MRFLSYATPRQDLALVNDAHTDRTQLYSAARSIEDAGTKVTTNEIMAETLGYLDSHDYFKFAQPGVAPSSGEGVYSVSLELETPTHGVMHWSLRRDSTPKERQALQECCYAFRDVYNNTYQAQAVNRVPDFEGQQARAKKGSSKQP